MNFEIRKTGNTIVVHANQVVEDKENNTVTCLGAETTYKTIAAGNRDVALKKQHTTEPFLMLTKKQAKQLGTLLLAESKDD